MLKLACQKWWRLIFHASLQRFDYAPFFTLLASLHGCATCSNFFVEIENFIGRKLNSLGFKFLGWSFKKVKWKFLKSKVWKLLLKALWKLLLKAYKLSKASFHDVHKNMAKHTSKRKFHFPFLSFRRDTREAAYVIKVFHLRLIFITVIYWMFTSSYFLVFCIIHTNSFNNLQSLLISLNLHELRAKFQ